MALAAAAVPVTPLPAPPLFPFGAHLVGAGASRRGFSSLPPYQVPDAGAALTDADVAPAVPASIPSEVAWIAQDSSPSVAAVQHLIDAVHSFTGLNWWLSIAVSTVLLRSALFALTFSVRKQIAVLPQEFSAFLKLLKSANDEKSVQVAEDRAISLLKSIGPLAFIAILQPYTFMSLYFAISNMVQKLPSLKEGGAFWFTDLTTPDALYIFPAMVSLSFLLRLEFVLHNLKTKRPLKTDVLKALLVLTFPIAAIFPKAICCYFITWSFASLAQMIVLNQPAVKKLLLNKSNDPASEGPTGLTSEGSPRSADEIEQPHPSERREASDSSVDQVSDKTDKKSEKNS
ncbi:unnamed protein product [Urochloa decumbens]|uniref:Uncharacterized protein n=1 Tax=Urochloa decumbens TaxID=240449 RepID=A0ABC9DAA4_9POAL